MSGVLRKTSIVLLLCGFIAFRFSHSCDLDHCVECLGNSCGKCTDGYKVDQRLWAGGLCVKKGEDSGGCFPGSAMVTTRIGNVAMDRLNIGDSVLTEVGNSQLGYTKVVGFAQREPDKEGHYLSITAVNQAGHTHTVKLTHTHNIYLKSKMADVHDDFIPRFAADVLVGDILKIQTDNGTALNAATVTHVGLHKEMGVYNPLTETGTMLVDGTLVSCYPSFNHYLIHLATAPIRWFPWLFAGEKPLDGELLYVETLKYIARSYIAPIVSLN